MIDLIIAVLVDQAQQQSFAEAFAVICALLYPYLAAKQNILCWPFALISTGLYIHVFWEVSLPFNSFLNGYYVVMAIYGWLKWRKNETGDSLQISVYPPRYHLVAIIILFFIGLALSHLVTFSWFNNDLLLDASVTVFSVYATYLMAHKILENWLFWIVINIFAAYLYFTNGLILTGALFVGYVFLAVYGYLNWKSDYAKKVTVT